MTYTVTDLLLGIVIVWIGPFLTLAIVLIIHGPRRTRSRRGYQPKGTGKIPTNPPNQGSSGKR